MPINFKINHWEINESKISHKWINFLAFNRMKSIKKQILVLGWILVLRNEYRYWETNTGIENQTLVLRNEYWYIENQTLVYWAIVTKCAFGTRNKAETQMQCREWKESLLRMETRFFRRQTRKLRKLSQKICFWRFQWNTFKPRSNWIKLLLRWL